ncbi:MAG: hypothetical protein Q4B29_00455 [Candidatus Saccharibacteria bacterium]|nr:hypothetical protein [Candidatus Saccharibacteria bacterium]
MAWVIYGFVILLAYDEHKRDYYFFIDLPRSPQGFLIGLSTLPMFPVYIISGIRLGIWHLMRHREEIEAAKESLKKQEKIDRQINSESRKLRRRARETYIKYVTRTRISGIESRRRYLTGLVKDQEKDLHTLGERLREMQRNLAENRKELAGLQIETEAESRKRARKEWDQIRDMRGVIGVSVDGDDRLVLKVRVHVEYKKELYDFGDYVVKIGQGESFYATEIRSGRLKNPTSARPYYMERSGFCFGSRKSEIQMYLRNGQLIEAITLIIDSLHSANPSDEDGIPECFRKVSLIENLKRKARG